MTEVVTKTTRPVVKVHRKKKEKKEKKEEEEKGVVQVVKNKRPVVKVHRKKKEEEIHKRKVSDGSSDLISLSATVVSRDELKRSKTMGEIEDDEITKQILELRYQEMILREKSEALVAENENKNVIISRLEARVSELEGSFNYAQLEAAQKEAREWEAQARELVDEGNKAIDELDKRCTDWEARYAMLRNVYDQLLAKHKKTAESVQLLEGALEKREVLLKEQDKKILQLRDNSGEVMLIEQASIQMLEEREARLVASMSALEETQKRCTVYKKRVDKAEAELEIKEKALEEALLEIKEFKKKEVDWELRLGSANRTISITGPDETAELFRVKASNTALELKLLTAESELKETKRQLSSLEAEVKNIVSQRDDMKKSRDDTSKSVAKKNDRLDSYKKKIDALQKELNERDARYKKMSNEARLRSESSKKAALASAQEDYTRSQIELADLQQNFKEVCRELEVLKMTGGSGAAREDDDVREELSEFKKSYARIVDSNKKWEAAYKEVVEKNVAWKTAEVSWVAKMAKTEEKLVEASQTLLVLERKLEQMPPDEYISVMESAMCVFISNFEETMGLLSSSGFVPKPALAQVFADFPSFKSAAEKLMSIRAQGGVMDKEAFQTVARFISTDLSRETQVHPLEKMVSVYHVTIAALQSYWPTST